MSSVRRALISVSDKTRIGELGRKLNELGVEILSTGGTAKLLQDEGVPVRLVSDYTGFPEMMGGRIKTLHPKIHGAILGRRHLDEDIQAMQTHEIEAIDLVVINLYPFEATIRKENCTLEEAIENIDIGGPAMIRSAAKNYKDVGVVVDPADYDVVLEELSGNEGGLTLETRKRLSQKAYSLTARYDATISRYLAGQQESKTTFGPSFQEPYEKIQDLRYGENPHQSAALYKDVQASENDLVSARQLQGKELSFNNFLDMNAVWELVSEFEESASVIVKHSNPCGVALGINQRESFIAARETDPVSAFGGILGFNHPVDKATAEEITKNFVEVIIAPGYAPEALEIFAKKKNVRVMEMPETAVKHSPRRYDIKRVGGGLLVQDADTLGYDPKKLSSVSERTPTEEELASLKFAWIVAKHVKSNAIVYARGNETVGVGAGQMSRVDSARLAIEKAQKPVAGCVMASDAFFPFRDAVDAAAENGITAIIQPGGSIRDNEIIEAANEHKMAMVFTGIRHFKH